MSHFVAHSIARGFIYRAIWSVTRGMSAPECVAMAVVAVVVLFLAARNARF